MTELLGYGPKKLDVVITYFKQVDTRVARAFAYSIFEDLNKYLGKVDLVSLQREMTKYHFPDLCKTG